MKGRTLGSILITAAVLAVAGCGGSGDPIPPGEATVLEADLAELQDQLELGDCDAADDKVSDLLIRARDLPRGDVKSGLVELLENLDDQVAAECPVGQETTTSETTSTTSTTTTEEPTTTTETTTSEPTTTTDTEPTTTTDTAPPSGGGGGGGSGGTSPGGSDGGGG